MGKRLLAVVMLGLVLVLSGCLGDSVQDDIMNYVNKETTEAAELEGKAIAAYEGVSGANYQDDQIMYDALVNEVIPNYTEFIEELEAVKIETDELKEIHEIYLNGADLQLQGFVKVVEALEKQDASIVEEANQLLNEGKSMIEDYQKKLDTLAKDHDVELEKK
jgi:hypothetical protein